MALLSVTDNLIFVNSRPYQNCKCVCRWSVQARLHSRGSPWSAWIRLGRASQPNFEAALKRRWCKRNQHWWGEALRQKRLWILRNCKHLRQQGLWGILVLIKYTKASQNGPMEVAKLRKCWGQLHEQRLMDYLSSGDTGDGRSDQTVSISDTQLFCADSAGIQRHWRHRLESRSKICNCAGKSKLKELRVANCILQ